MDGQYQHNLGTEEETLAMSPALAAGSLVYGFRQSKGIAPLKAACKGGGQRRTPSGRAGSSTEVCLEGVHPLASCLLLAHGGVVPSVTQVPPYKERSSTLRVADGSSASSTLRVDMITETPDLLLLGGPAITCHPSYPVYTRSHVFNGSTLGTSTSVDL